MSERKYKIVNIKDWAYIEIENQGNNIHSLNIYTTKYIYKLHISYNSFIEYLIDKLKVIVLKRKEDLTHTIKKFSEGFIEED